MRECCVAIRNDAAEEGSLTCLFYERAGRKRVCTQRDHICIDCNVCVRVFRMIALT